MGIPYLECSSKTGENVAEVFHTLLKEIEKDDGLLNDKEEDKCPRTKVEDRWKL